MPSLRTALAVVRAYKRGRVGPGDWLSPVEGDGPRVNGSAAYGPAVALNIVSDIMKPVRLRGYSWTAGARRHGISREQVRHVVERCGLVQVRRANPPGRPDEALLLLGDDADGTALEVAGVLLDDGRLRVIHAMEMREKYRPLYEEAKRWRL